jgi:hypothetical protein
MRAFAAAAILLVFGAAEAPAQRRGFHPGIVGGHPGIVGHRTYGSPTGFGNILAPGMGNLPPLVNPFGFPSTFAQRLGATISGFPGYPGVRGRRRGFATTLAVPVPVYVGDPYGYAYQEPQQQPNITIVMPPAQPAPPPVTIHQHFGEGAQPVIREYGPEGEEIRTYRAPTVNRPAPPDDDVMFLVPLKDHSVYSAKAYWVEGEMLHYITHQGRHNQVSLDLVDRELADRLNKGRKVEFRLPQVKGK